MSKSISTSLPPFSKDAELYTKLHLDPAFQRLTRNSSKGQADQKKPATLPNHPQIILDDPFLHNHLVREFRTGYLDRFSPHLWLVATQSHSHISSLTHQLVRRRNIIISEDPRLHLLWYHDRIYIKPLPPYLLSHAFWVYLLDPRSPIPSPAREEILLAARGYLRSWSYLITHRSDFKLAVSLRLLPQTTPTLRFGALMRLLGQVRDSVAADEVSPRYAFGELRISRINFWSQVMLQRFYYHKSGGQYSAYFSRYFGIILFLFAFFSTALSAMQVALAALGTTSPLVGQFGGGWEAVVSVSGWFAVVVLMIVSSILLFLGTKWVFMLGREIIYALKSLWRKRKP